jgi:hypothetical protein
MGELWGRARHGFLPFLFARKLRVYDLFNQYLIIFLLSYFGLIIVGVWLGLGVIEVWFSLWNPLTDLLALFIPAFDNIHRALVDTQYAERLPVIRHFFAFGWLTTIAVTAFTIVLVFTLPEEDWRRLLSRYPRSRFMIMGLILLFLLVPSTLMLGTAWRYSASGFLGTWHQNELKLMLLALVFFGQALLSALLVLLCAALAFSWRYGSATDAGAEPL